MLGQVFHRYEVCGEESPDDFSHREIGQHEYLEPALILDEGQARLQDKPWEAYHGAQVYKENSRGFEPYHFVSAPHVLNSAHRCFHLHPFKHCLVEALRVVCIYQPIDDPVLIIQVVNLIVMVSAMVLPIFEHIGHVENDDVLFDNDERSIGAYK